jgi:hypothetical protein
VCAGRASTQVGDRRLGKREIIARALSRMRSLGIGDPPHLGPGVDVTKAIGESKLNVTELSEVPGVRSARARRSAKGVGGAAPFRARLSHLHA